MNEQLLNAIADAATKGIEVAIGSSGGFIYAKATSLEWSCRKVVSIEQCRQSKIDLVAIAVVQCIDRIDRERSGQ